ncbi:hypothetical protein G6M89_17455 [Natronolimnobius sp. AArcel1]|uniref:DUF7289 family protein n=1 Tax=Natronolimnobius sp. AArcel1 TaxID=1679093 RepID=UPI0013EB1A41|nr:hypothetical protein [Natronolimnobius sp. AArcel1]NGM70769.1 hypothetical protein [Natronolimnobius sp. AArcel1]
MGDNWGAILRNDSKGEAQLIATVLLFGFVIIFGISILFAGNMALTGIQGVSQDETATQSLENAKVDLESLEESTATEISFSDRTSEQTQVDADAGSMTIRTPDGKEHHTKLGAIIYDQEDSHIAYQGGGVWDYQNGNTTPVSRPNFEITTDQTGIYTIHFDTVHLQDGNHSDDDLVARSNGQTDAFKDIPNQVRDGTTTIEVDSKYYEGWGELFEDTGVLDVEYNHSENTVLANLNHSSPTTLENALSVDGQLDIGGGTFVSSYDSSQNSNEGDVGIGEYEETDTGSVLVSDGFSGSGSTDIGGDIFVNGDFEVSGGADVEDSNIYSTGDIGIGSVNIDEEIVADGDLTVTSGGASFGDGSEIRTGGDFTDTNGGTVYNGLIHTAGSFEGSGGGSELGSSGEVRAKEVQLTNAVDGSIIRAETDWEVEEDNNAEIRNEDVDTPSLSETDFIEEHTESLPQPVAEVENASELYESSNDELDEFDGDSVEVTSGDYYHDGSIDYGGNLVFDVTGGDINLVVDGDFYGPDLDVEVVGDGDVNLYVDGSFRTTGGASWTNSDGAGDRLWIYIADSEEESYIQASHEGFYGVVFSESSVELGGGTDLYGAISSAGSEISGGQSIYYDEAIEDTRISKTVNRDDYSYTDISVDEVTIESD